MEVKGARMFPESEAWRALPKSANLLSLDSEALKGSVKSNPWVKGVSVLKDWESGIVTVEVEERTAVLDADVGGRRVVAAADGTMLPSSGGASLSRVEVDEAQLEASIKVGEALEENGLLLDSVDAVDAGGVEATVEGHRVLFAGDGAGVQGPQLRALEGIMEEHADAPYFDLRSPGRVVVGAEPGARSGGLSGTDG